MNQQRNGGLPGPAGTSDRGPEFPDLPEASAETQPGAREPEVSAETQPGAPEPGVGPGAASAGRSNRMRGPFTTAPNPP